MRRLVLPLFISVLAVPAVATAQSIGSTATDGSLAGTREIGLSVTGRVLSTAYSVSDGRGPRRSPRKLAKPQKKPK